MTVGRFAPSPSGRMHLGNLFTALLAWLSVRSQNGKMLLRIEDLDPDRSKREYIDALKDDLQWLGLTYDEEMPLQSTRTARYAEAFSQLPAYPCYCSRNELHVASAPHASDGNLIYAGTCRNLTEDERSAKTRAPAWRVRVPDAEIAFTDGVFGEQRENLAKDCGDFIVRRSDGVYAYQLAVVCDDADGGVTEVVRGCDLLSSTPRQIWLYQTLGLPVPRFYHVPLLVAPDGKRLSKREKSLDMAHLRERFRPEELTGMLAFLAKLVETPAPVRATELIGGFSWSRVGREPIVVDPQDFSEKH
ncbi:MAG: tRNA glutamyl-Q(34) synthetase GluQRS [Oscillospiraceae bacterium]|nr:tRNA glutamyl-Q(34) synthetase GluQRS [Oscillospiraceae bacterium]